MTRKYLITPKEALTLADKVLTTREMQWAHALHVEYNAMNPQRDIQWDIASMIAAAYNAGLVQGIREGRKKKA